MKWNKRFALALALIFGVLSAQAIEVKTLPFVERDSTLYMDVYLPDDTLSQHPCVFFMFGGGFKGGLRNRVAERRYMTEIAQAGMVGIAIDYRLGLKNGIPEKLKEQVKAMQHSILIGVEDTYAAVNFALAHAEEWKINPQQIVLSGSSAGAIIALQSDYFLQKKHPASAILPEGFRFGGIVAFSGAVIDLENRIKYEGQPAPTLFMHGTKDKLVLYKKARFFGKGIVGASCLAKKFKKEDWPYQIIRYKDFGHEISTIAFKENSDLVVSFVNTFVVKQMPLQIDVKWKEMGIEKPIVESSIMSYYTKKDQSVEISPENFKRISNYE